QALNDALLAKLRNTLRRQHGFPKASDARGKPLKRVPRMGVRALWFDQPAILPAAWARAAEADDDMGAAAQAVAPQGLSCAGYGSVVMVTAAMGLAVANEAVRLALAPAARPAA
ncbi:MAG TPA: tRNA threonylcarbamoyladenosine dehydratase, partial [Bordetella sp.]|nr:tRNA threonylcarbamoyladenosine dehydratase [Bordetella sp.]